MKNLTWKIFLVLVYLSGVVTGKVLVTPLVFPDAPTMPPNVSVHPVGADVATTAENVDPQPGATVCSTFSEEVK
jgi:hypothetical protein